MTSFVSVKGHHFFVANKPLYYIGTNYWYGGLLGLEINKEKGVERLRLELDFLKSKGVTNLRVLAGAEGVGMVSGVERVGPPLQTRKAVFDEEFLKGLDLLITEMAKRNMKAVIFMSNNWEWSGGFLQYLNWNGRMEDSVFRRKLSWDETRDYVSEFYSCGPCKADYLKQVEHILGHTNSISKKKYTDDPAIMSWEIANEPRPMRPAAIPEYKNWISDVAAFIKSKDRNHLVTIGTEGDIGTENIAVYEAIHADKHIDYLTIHIWPKNWNWFSGIEIAAGMDSVLDKTKQYISRHLSVAVKLNKPLVIEEFGLPRDGHSYDLTSTTTFRDKYYNSIFIALQKSKDNNGFLAGANFWSYGGVVEPVRVHWQKGDEYIGDPPMEEQGLNAVFNGDESTWNLIKSFYLKL
ncbi:MAG: cellulase family glycosylhydrolase [Ferruginibacter sp.]|nr:cellulase family glycosylhydrolase [Ferruginibacter sp.]